MWTSRPTNPRGGCAPSRIPSPRLRACLISAAAIILLLGADRRVAAQDVGAPSNTTIPVSCTINGRPASDLSVTLSPSGKLLGVDGPSLLALLKQPASPSLLADLSTLVARSTTVTPAELSKAGLSVAFDTQTLELRIGIPQELQRVTGIRITENTPPSTAVRVTPAAFSAQLSATGQVDFIDQYATGGGGSPSTNSLDVPLSLALDPALNYRTWVLESDLTVNAPAAQPFTVNDLRLVKDFPGPDLRLTAGTLSYRTTGFGSGVPILGVGIESNSNLSPARLYRPLGHLGFYLEHPSQVTVLVNGQPVRYLQLQPGPYSLSDFPFTPGMNDVVLEIRDSQGRVERVARSFAFAQDLLLPGRSSFSANIGLPGWKIASPVFSGYERIGLTDSLTVGGYAQADTMNQLAGIEGTVATPVGTLHLDVAGSHSSTHPMDIGAYAGYRFFEVSRPFVPTFSLSAQYRGQYLLGPESYLSQSPFKWIFRGAVSQALPEHIGVNLGLDYSLPWSGAPSYAGTAIVSAPIANGVSLSVTAGASYTPGGQPVWSGGISIISSGRSAAVTSANQSLTDPSAQMSVSFRPPQLPGLSVDGTVSGPPGIPGQPTSASATVHYLGNRFRASVGHTISDDGLSNPTTVTNHSFLRFGSAVVYADGVFGVSRPVYDDFAIFVPRAPLRKVPIDVNPALGSYQARSDFLGDAVLPDLSSYTNTLARVEVPNAPIGYDLGNTLYLLSLPYRSGAIVHVGTSATVYVKGTIVDAAGKPVPLVAGSLASKGTSGPPEPFFTDESGQFEAYRLTPGTYTLTLSAGHWAPVTVKIREGASGLYELGTITVTH